MFRTNTHKKNTAITNRNFELSPITNIKNEKPIKKQQLRIGKHLKSQITTRRLYAASQGKKSKVRDAVFVQLAFELGRFRTLWGVERGLAIQHVRDNASAKKLIQCGRDTANEKKQKNHSGNPFFAFLAGKRRSHAATGGSWDNRAELEVAWGE